MSLLPLIRFRNLDSELSDDEFFHQFAKGIGRELITTLLFNHFKNNLNETATVTKIQSDIINNREDEPQIFISYDCFDKLPSELISECASYLNYKQYFRLAKCNRKTFIACHATPKIQKLDLVYIKNQESADVNLTAFKNVQSLKMRIADFNALSPSNKSIWCNNNSIHTVTLYNLIINEDDITSFINNQHLINYNNVTTLTLSFFRSESIYDILSNFSQIHNLKLLHVKNANEIKKCKWFPNVKSLELVGVNTIFAGNIISALYNIETLSFYGTIPANTTFRKLQTLKLRNPSNVNILKKPQTLKCVTIESGKEEIIKTFIENTIRKQLTLENITIQSVNVSSIYVLQKIESIMDKNRNIKRKSKKLCMKLVFYDEDPCDDTHLFGLQMFRTINVFNASDINNWCLKIERKGPFNFDAEYLQNALNDMKRNYMVDYKINKYELTVVISNTK